VDKGKWRVLCKDKERVKSIINIIFYLKSSAKKKCGRVKALS
jgi:CRISPR/Cas system-associated protein Cas7 (RAMP superfamily)